MCDLGSSFASVVLWLRFRACGTPSVVLVGGPSASAAVLEVCFPVGIFVFLLLSLFSGIRVALSGAVYTCLVPVAFSACRVVGLKG